jgi:hypothetical protein
VSKMSRRIVVDASVARSAGETSHPDSVLCREFLLAILKICHRVVLTPETEREWHRHASRFSMRWLATMRSRRKVVDANLTFTLASLLGGSPDLVGPRFDAVEKDCLLVDAALACDGLIVSRDDKMRAIPRTVARDIEQLQGLVWVNPVAGSEAPPQWLNSGARSEPARQLRNS